MRSILDNKKAQMDMPIVVFAGMVIALLMLAPIILKIVRTSIEPVSSALNNSGSVGGELGAQNMTYILGIFVGFWDGVLLFAFVFLVLLLIISSLFIDTHPIFIIVYIIAFFLTVLFAPEMLGAINKVYEANEFATDVALLPMLDFIRLNFGVILTAIGVLTMVIMYAKVKFFSSGGSY